jgi:hypothetical protein
VRELFPNGVIRPTVVNVAVRRDPFVSRVRLPFPLVPDTTPQVLAGRYRLVVPLGQGGMGRVWRAVDELLLRDVAVKELVLPSAATDRERGDLRERALREARAIARIDQANVVRLFDVVHDGGQPWIVMELVPSRSLQDVLGAYGPISPARAARIGLGVLAALRAAHRAGILHRDVKPANILLADDGRVVLTDFGVASAVEDPSITVTGIVMGSPQYLAPERATDGMIGPAADLWSLGATLYAAVEGRPPYDRSTGVATLAALATERPAPPERAGVLTAALEGLLRKDPRDRADPDETERLLRTAAASVPDEQSTVDGSGGAPPWWVSALGRVTSDTTTTVAAPAPPGGPTASGAAGDPAGTGGADPATAGHTGTPSDADAAGGTAGATDPAAHLGTAGDTHAARGTDPASGAPAPALPGAGAESPSGREGRDDSIRPGRSAGGTWADADPGRPRPGPTWADPTDSTGTRDGLGTGGGVLGGLGALGRRPRRATLAALLAVPVLALAVAVPLLLNRFGGPSTTGTRGEPARAGHGAFPSAAVIPSGPPAAGAAPSRSAPVSAAPSRTPSASAGRSGTPAALTPVATEKPLRNVGTGKCIDLPGADRNTTSAIHVWDCFGGAGETFTLPGDGTLRVLGRCLELASTANGSPLRVTDCTSGDLQRFAMNTAGTLTSVRTGKCLEPTGGDSTNGAWLRAWDCTGVEHQKWRIG